MNQKPKKIETIHELQQHLQTAIELEHATIPAYLTALYSIKEGSNPEASLVIRSVVIEEMLHLTLAANLLNAVGGQPSINSEGFVPCYPTRLPHSAAKIEVSLAPFCEKTIKTFMRIEHPAFSDDPKPQPDQYETIGQFYEAIEDGIDRLCDEHGEASVFTGQLSRQVTPAQYYGSGGRIFVVHDRKTAHDAISEIIDQGEGSDAGHKIFEAPERKRSRPNDQVAHFYRFDEIRQGRYYEDKDEPGEPSGPPLDRDWKAVWPIRPDTKASDFPAGSEIRAMLDDFNRAYKNLLNTLHAAFNGEPERIAETVPVMYDLRYRAQAICCVPIPDDRCGEHVGPSWEWVPD